MNTQSRRSFIPFGFNTPELAPAFCKRDRPGAISKKTLKMVTGGDSFRWISKKKN
jgi:hypothetical protein|tara:strand:- start:68 stop:232 length:165 start_codon:yes stop_codon:yes gene_type:complete